MELERRRIAQVTPGWQWCLNPKCSSGQVHGENAKIQVADTRSTRKQPKTKTKVESLSEQPFVCKSCDQSFCISCAAPWHEAETCEQYQKRTEGKRAVEIAATEKTVNKIAKNCPHAGCNTPTQRDGGCPHMYCKWFPTNPDLADIVRHSLPPRLVLELPQNLHSGPL